MTAVELPPALQTLTSRLTSSSISELPPLRPTKPYDPSLASQIDSFIKSSNEKQSLRAALHLINDDIERAHKIAQANEGDSTSDLCHAILHRREADYWNSKWWLRMIKHPLIDEIYGSTAKAQSYVDAVEAIVLNKKGASTACAAGNLEQLKQKQAQELNALLRFTMKGE